MQYQPTFPGWVHLPEKRDCRTTHTDRTPEIDFQLRAGIGVGGALDFAKQPIPSVVEYDVEPSKNLLGPSKGGGDIRGASDIEGEEKELRGWVVLGERGEDGGIAKGSHDNVAFAEDDLGEGFSEPRGRACDCHDCDMSVQVNMSASRGTH